MAQVRGLRPVEGVTRKCQRVQYGVGTKLANFGATKLANFGGLKLINFATPKLANFGDQS